MPDLSGRSPKMSRLPVVDRPRLLIPLDGVPALMILHAPSGFGKTTLLTQWSTQLERGGLSVLRISATSPHEGESPWRQIVEQLGIDSPIEDPRNAAKSWAEGLTDTTVVAIDDYWLLTSVEFDREVIELLRATPDLHLLIASRQIFAFTNPLLTNSLTSVTLTASELGLTADEVAELAVLHGVDDAQLAADIFDDFEGWPLGIQMALLATATGRPRAAVYADFAAATFSLLGEVDRQILTAIATVALLDSAVLAGALRLSEYEVLERISSLRRSGVLVADVMVPHPAHRVRPALRALIAEVGKQTWAPGDLDHLRRMNARYIANSLPVAAFLALLETGSFDDAELLGRRHFSSILEDASTVAGALRRAPHQEVVQRLSLSMFRLILERTVPSVPVESVHRMAQQLRATNIEAMETGDEADAVLAAGTLIAVERMMGNWDNALLLSNWVDERLSHSGRAAHIGSWDHLPINYAVASLTGILGGDFALAIRAADNGYAESLSQHNLLEQTHALSLGALALALRGEPERALEKLQVADKISQHLAEAQPEYSWADRQIARVLLGRDFGDVEQTQKALDALTGSMGRMEQWPVIVYAESGLRRTQFGPSDALQQMQRRLSERPGGVAVSPFWEDLLNAQQGTLATIAGRYRSAQSLLEHDNPGVSVLIAQARLALFRGHPAKAYGMLDAAASKPTTAQNDIEVQLLRAVALHLEGRDHEARAAIRSYLDLIPTSSHRRELGAVPFDMLKGLARSAQSETFDLLLEAFPEKYRVVSRETLTPAETEVVRALAAGHRMTETADALFISENTLASHRKSIYAKLGVSNRAAAVSAAWNLGLLDG